MGAVTPAARQEAAFFDLDKTVIAKASMVAFGRPLLRAGLLSRWLLLRALYGQLVYLYLGADEARMARMRESALRLTKGWSQDRINRVVRETIAEVIDPIIYDEAIELIERHRAEGRRVFIVSASPEEVVAPLAEYLGAHEAIATRAQVDPSGRYTGEVDFYSYGPFKAEAIEDVAQAQGIDLAASYAYSDSATDIPMLEVVGHPVVVNPDKALARYAEQREWEVRTFSHKVRLRDRVPMPTPAATAAMSSGLVGLAGAATLWWWLRRDRPQTRTERALATARRAAAVPAALRVRRPGASWPPSRRGRPG